MADIRITDLVDPEEIKKLKELDAELMTVLDTYTKVAKDLAQGLEVDIKVAGDIDKLEKLLTVKGKEAVEVQQKLTEVMQEQSQVVANTTNTISRQLMEQERVNKTTRATYTEQERVKKLLDQYHDTYENQIDSLIRINRQLEENKKKQKNNEQALKMGRMSASDFAKAQAELMASTRDLTQQKRTLNQIMTAEEKANQAVEGSYTQLSQQLELLKKAYKEMGDEAKASDFGREMEEAIQNLDAHLKDMAADMGEFQRNVGNYAIAGRDGVVSTESLMAVLEKQAVTTKDLTDQNKILIEARGMLDTSDKDYAETVAMINSKLEENGRKLTDVSDIMGVQAKTVAEAEAQNQRLVAALKNVDLTREDSQKNIDAINGKIEENNKIISESVTKQSSLKKDLKDLVLEIATLTIKYNEMNEAEQNSSEGQELSQKIQDLTEKAGVLRDVIADTNAAINNAASDTRGFDQVSEGIQMCIDGFGLATGAAEMLGISENDLAEVQTKLQAAIAASNAMSKIQNALQKQSALMQGAMNLKTQAGIIAIKLKTAAEGKGIITTKLLTAAQWLFNKAASANPIGIVALGVTACIGAVTGLIKVFNLFGSSSEKRKQEYKREAKALEDLQKLNDKNIEIAKARGASEWEAARLAIDAKLEEMAMAEKAFAAARRAYDEDEEEYKEALKAKTDATEDYKQMLDDHYKGILKFIQKYRDKEREDAIGTVAFKKEVAQKDFEEQYGLLISYYSAEQAAIRKQIEFYKLIYGALLDADNEAAKVGLANLEEQLKASETKLQTDISGLISAKNQRIKDAEDEQAKKDKEAAKKAAEAEKKRQADILKEMRTARQKQIELIEDFEERKTALENEQFNNEKADLLKKISELGKDEVQKKQALEDQLRALSMKHERNLSVIKAEGEMERLKIQKEIINLQLAAVEDGSHKELELRQQLLQNSLASEVAGVTKRVELCELTEEEGEKMILAIKQKYAEEGDKLIEDYAKKAVDKIQKDYADRRSIQDASFITESNALKNKYAQELAQAKGNTEEQAKIKAKFEKDQAKLTEKYAKQSAKASVDMLEEMLKNEQLSADDRKDIELRLIKAKADMEQVWADAAKQAAEDAVNADNDATEKRMANAQQWLQVASDSLNAINDLVSSVYEAKITKIEEEQEANTAAGEAEQERITQLVEKKVITEEEGEARKRAAEAKTAKKNEELEKKKQQLKHKQAVWDKANSIAQAGIATALSLMQLWVTPGWPAAIPMMAVVAALGAAQLATILATPIPKYAKGTDRHKGGPAIVGDGGVPELVIFGGKAWITPDTPTIVDLPTGTVVKPNIDGIDDNTPGLTLMPIAGEKGTPVIVNNDYSRLEDKIDKLIFIMRRHSNRQHQKSIDDSLNRYIADRI